MFPRNISRNSEKKSPFSISDLLIIQFIISFLIWEYVIIDLQLLVGWTITSIQVTYRTRAQQMEKLL